MSTKRSLSEMKAEDHMSSAGLKGLEILKEDVATLQAKMPPWMNSIQDVILPNYVCPPDDQNLSFLEVNKPSDPKQARVRATVTPVLLPEEVQHHHIRMELDVDLLEYPTHSWPRLWIRSAGATPAALTDDGSFHSHFAMHFEEAMDKHSHRERNPIETMLWFFVNRYLTLHPVQADKEWPSHLTIPAQFYHHIIDDWKTADALMEGSGDKELAKPHSDFGSLEDWLDPQVSEWLKNRQATKSEVGTTVPDQEPSKATSDKDGIDENYKPPPFVQEISPNVYIFPLWTPEFCERVTNAFLKEKDYAAKHDIPVHRPNNMNTSGAIMKALGMESLMDVLQDRVLEPIAQDLFPETGSEFTNHHSFLVHYTAGMDLGLDMHTDDSDVTFNCCLGREFTGAKLQICGVMGEPDHRQSRLEYSHRPGWVICHLGRQRHGADDIDSGERINLINWNHNKVWRRSAENVAQEYQQESGPPDLQCLSYTHDRDWEKYKGKRPYDTGRRPWCPPRHAEHMADVPEPYPVGD